MTSAETALHCGPKNEKSPFALHHASHELDLK